MLTTLHSDKFGSMYEEDKDGDIEYTQLSHLDFWTIKNPKSVYPPFAHLIIGDLNDV